MESETRDLWPAAIIRELGKFWFMHLKSEEEHTQTQNGPTLQPCENTSEGIGASSQRGTNASNHSKEDNKDKINTNAAITETCHRINSASIEFSHHINQSKNNK